LWDTENKTTGLVIESCHQENPDAIKTPDYRPGMSYHSLTDCLFGVFLVSQVTNLTGVNINCLELNVSWFVVGHRVRCHGLLDLAAERGIEGEYDRSDEWL